ncbi:tetratricopeptide repeat protein [Methanosarcina hadiensis]|uniref:tetratricopeptide repeat protein n=1 Tax=Methanosarcina hadiensis TaxID=3078083 RepID=UPI003977AD3B
MIYEKTFEKIGSTGVKRARALLEKMSPKMSESLEKALINTSENSKDPKAKEDLQQEILKLLRENPDIARKIELIINLNVENVDQLAVGNYNNFFNLETPSGDEFIQIIEYLAQRRKEEKNKKVMSRYNPSVLPYYPEKLKQFVTENRADELRKALIYLENHRILLLSGVGGVGKSTLARALIDLRPVDVPEPFWFDFNKNQSVKLGDILEKLASYLKAPEIISFKDERREAGKLDVDKLTGELHRRNRIWLIFDDLSTILEDQHFADIEIELLFSSLRYNTHNAKVIITSRILPIFENGESLLDVVENEEKQHLNGLRKDFAIDYLASNGLDKVEPKKLEELATGVDGHPLALKLLIELVKEFGVKDTLEDLSMYQEQKENTIIKARKLFDKLAGEEKGLLERISVYREPIDIKGLKEMFTENTPKNSVKKLIDKSLLETDHNGKYWLHPLVREFSYEDLKNKKETHILAVKYYLLFSLPKNPTNKEHLRSATEAHYHACKAEEYDLAANIIWMYKLPDLLDLWGNSRTLIEIYEKLLPKDHFKDETLLKNRSIHGYILGNLGHAHSNLGEPRKAIKYYEQALKFVREAGERREEGAALGNIGNEYCYLGEPKRAIEYYEQALKILRETGDRRAEGNLLGNLGNAHSDLRDSRKAIEYYEQALRIARETGDRRAEGYLLGNLGNAYNGLGETRTAIGYFEQAIGILREMGARHGVENHLGNLGNAYRRLGKLRKAIECYEKALNISREIGDQRGEGNHLGRLGVVYSDLGEPRKAIEFLKQSLSIGKEIEDPKIIRHCEQNLKKLEEINE